jgi:4'-phosphopantetheinyl transferase
MNVYWLAQCEADVPQSNEWLGSRERTHLRTLTFLKRRTDWRLGRWTAKCALAALHNVPSDPVLLAGTEIRPSPSGAPEVFVDDAPSDVIISISHRAGAALCVLAQIPVRLGCDLELVETRSEAFVSDYFTAEEQDLIRRVAEPRRSKIINLLWSAKESALKALREGLRRDTRFMTVQLGESFLTNLWSPLRVRSADGDSFEGWWYESHGVVQTVVADRCFAPPVQLATIPAVSVA